MKRTDAPTKQPVPFGENGQRESLLPVAQPGDNAASYELGFPPITMIPKAAGGLPPKGRDMNQILYELSALCRWNSAGALNTYDGDFSSAIGGYPAGALLISDDGDSIYINTQDNNESNPNVSGGGWVNLRTYTEPTDTLLPVGVPVPWPSDTLPAGYALMQGQTFNRAQYPKLALAYPNGIIPDMRGQTIKGKPASGRQVLSAESDGIKSHTHTGTVASTDLGTKSTSSFDYGQKTTSAFDYGTKTTDTTGAHTHTYSRFSIDGNNGGSGSSGNNYKVVLNPKSQDTSTASSGNHAHTVAIGSHTHTLAVGAHTHTLALGAHSHTLSINASGNTENTVKNIAFNYIVRLA